jgi:Holliday junction DNA helicase RuvA
LPNQKVTLFLTQVVREDAHTLYGFLERGARDLFETLITVSGIGPKTALTLIGHVDLATFHHAIISNDTRLLSKIPGIGKKTAERLVIEMRDKLKSLSKKGPAQSTTIPGIDSMVADAISALLNLGYNPATAQKAVQSAKAEREDVDLSSLIGLALKKI